MDPRRFLPGNPFKGEPPLPAFLLIDRTPAPEEAPRELPKPGCVAADDAILVHGHLLGLAAGLGGFGLLRLSKERMEHAAQAAEWVNEPELAREMMRFAGLLPDIHDEDAAAEALDKMKPIIEEAWKLGVRCGRTQAALAKAQAAITDRRGG